MLQTSLRKMEQPPSYASSFSPKRQGFLNKIFCCSRAQVPNQVLPHGYIPQRGLEDFSQSPSHEDSRESRASTQNISSSKMDSVTFVEKQPWEKVLIEWRNKSLDMMRACERIEYCIKNKKNSLDLSNLKLGILPPIFQYLDLVKSFYCTSCELKELDLSDFKSLENLMCDYNELETIDFSKCKKMNYVDCSNNKLEIIKTSNFSKLKSLICRNNKLLTVDLKNNNLLEYLDCSGNKIDMLDISSNQSIENLVCSNNHINEISFPSEIKLKNLLCSFNELQILNSPALNELYCDYNNFTTFENVSFEKLTLLEIENDTYQKFKNQIDAEREKYNNKCLVKIVSRK